MMSPWRLLLLSIALTATCGCSSSAGSSEGTCNLPGIDESNCARAQALLLPDTLPPSRGNQYGDDENAATLGFHLFFDATLGTGVACVNCHAPELAFTDRLSVSRGKTAGVRNAPTVFNAARLTVMFWDGRADSVWSQPLFAIENPAEMASTRLQLAQLIAQTDDYRTHYEAAFGPLPDMTSWPASGMPGDAAFDAMADDQKDLVNRVAANVGKSFEAYERKNSTADTALDLFLKGDATQLIPAEQRGLNVFLSNNCDSCHAGPMLTDDDFHNVGFPSTAGAADDPGRSAGVTILENNVFNLAGPYADPGPGVPGTPPTAVTQEGEFRTPSLRNVTRTDPYGHNGALASLSDVLAIHAPNLSPDDSGDLLALFQAFNGIYPPKPWNNWPSPQ